MRREVTAEAFGRLLEVLDRDRDRAAEKYEELRRLLIRFFEWRGAPFPEEHADETFDRVSRKLAEQPDIKNIGGYCYEVARLICLEALKKAERRVIAIDAHTVATNARTEADSAHREVRHGCLDRCVSQLPESSRMLILEYYGDDRRPTIERRRALAERLGIQRETLANRAQRVRNRLNAE